MLATSVSQSRHWGVCVSGRAICWRSSKNCLLWYSNMWKCGSCLSRACLLLVLKSFRGGYSEQGCSDLNSSCSHLLLKCFSQWANMFGRHRDIPGSYRCRRYHGLGGMKLHHFVVTTLGVCVVSSVKWKRWILSVFTRLCFEPQSDRWLIQSHSGTPWNNTVVAVVTMNKSTETMHVASCCLGSHQLSSLSIVLQTVPKG